MLSRTICGPGHSAMSGLRCPKHFRCIIRAVPDNLPGSGLRCPTHFRCIICAVPDYLHCHVCAVSSSFAAYFVLSLDNHPSASAASASAASAASASPASAASATSASASAASVKRQPFKQLLRTRIHHFQTNHDSPIFNNSSLVLDNLFDIFGNSQLAQFHKPHSFANLPKPQIAP